MFYCVEERKSEKGKWEVEEAREFRSRELANKEVIRRRALFGSTPNCRFVFTAVKPEGLDWE